MLYVEFADDGQIKACGNTPFGDAVLVSYDVVRVCGQLYRAGNEPTPTLADTQAIKRAEINAGFDAALAASLTMPSVNTPPSTVELTVAIGLFNAEDPVGLVDLCAIHEARRASLLAAVDAATTPEAVQAITVSYAV